MLISIAIDFRHADVATRERFHLSEERLTQLYRSARTDVVTESALIATCNRTELYAWIDADDPVAVERAVQRLARRWMRTRADGAELLQTATRREGIEAARHVVRIASGLESQVLGDGQILGQLKAAYKRASRGDAAGPVLHRLFETALRAGKRVQTETSLTAGRNSVGRRGGHHGGPALRQPRQRAVRDRRCGQDRRARRQAAPQAGGARPRDRQSLTGAGRGARSVRAGAGRQLGEPPCRGGDGRSW